MIRAPRLRYSTVLRSAQDQLGIRLADGEGSHIMDIGRITSYARFGGTTMANFRAERGFVMLEQPIPGLDHVKAIDPTELCSACTLSETDSDRLNLDSLYSFSIAA